ncbi:hypothetical protein KP509_05G012200 [Ceratopteris richardii]|uniref:Uncharacterized protein n=1 Tax=Ceratopteris richardii TaxID=49495 RepID=A0A8T2URB0_CERRI|nr:hypothetical protein KP509_05G012200 [Ceratopteris richardii]
MKPTNEQQRKNTYGSSNSHGNTEDEHNVERCMATAEQNRAEEAGYLPVQQNRFYMVVSRSIRAADADEELLYAADAEAHEEARH